jgi:cell pole-organizing protein PopZ
MTASPFAVPMNLVGLQTSFLKKMYQSALDVSMQFGNLNVTANRKLLEESTAAAAKAMSLKTPWEMQAFLVEQSQLACERGWGYCKNVQDIAAGVRSDLMTSASQQTAQPAAAQADEQTANEHAAPPHAHEVDPHPSALVEKMISSVVSDTDAVRH